jgi:sigma-B regulation protein RsbU (phosphoserine phosphatase)
MFPNQKFSVENLKLESGDTLILYTDGVPDAVNSRNEEYGTSRLVNIAAASWASGPDKLVAGSLADVSRFREGSPRFDDISIMGVRRK